MILSITSEGEVHILTNIDYFEITGCYDEDGNYNEESKLKTISMLASDGSWKDRVVTDKDFTITIRHESEVTT